jgi:hypothetical protein
VELVPFPFVHESRIFSAAYEADREKTTLSSALEWLLRPKITPPKSHHQNHTTKINCNLERLQDGGFVNQAAFGEAGEAE